MAQLVISQHIGLRPWLYMLVHIFCSQLSLYTVFSWSFFLKVFFNKDLRISCHNSLRPSDANIHRQHRPSLVQIMACACSAPSHYLNPWWNIVNWTLGNKFKWNCNKNLNIFIKKNAFKMVYVKWRPFCFWFNVIMGKLWGGWCFLVTLLWVWSLT